MTDMYIERLQDLSFLQFVKDIFEPYDFVTVTDDYATDELISSSLPLVSVENSLYSVDWIELGNRKGVDIRTWFINIYAKNKSQRDDYSYLIKNEIQEGVPVLNFNEGFPPDVSPSQLGSMRIDQLRIEPIPVLPGLVSTLYWRARIIVVATYNQPYS